MADTAEFLINHLIDEIEKDYSDRRADRGGKTRWGITEAKAREHGFTGPMSELPRALAVTIYRLDFVNAVGVDKVLPVSSAVGAELFEAGVVMGPSWPARFLQMGLNALNRAGRDYPNILEDGVVGGETVKALKAMLRTRGQAAEHALVAIMNGFELVRFVQLSRDDESQEDNVLGWILKRIRLS